MKKLIQQGAEAKIFLDKNIINKQRIKKSYRHPILDEKIRKSRTKKEAKLLTKAAEFINIPQVINQDKFNIQMQHIEGDRLSQTLNTYLQPKQFKIMKQLGSQVAKLHQNNIIHGDLTTSNIILSKTPNSQTPPTNQVSDTKPSGKLYIIDFGLGFISARIEDKAVDIHLIKQALEAKHWKNHEKLFKQFLEGYKFSETKKVLEQLRKVEARGRYKH